MVTPSSRAAVAARLLLWFGVLTVVIATLTGPVSVALAQAPEQQPVIPPATHLPPLDLNSLALKGGNQYQNCPKTPSTGEADCNLQEVTFDGPTSVNGLVSQAAHRTNMIAYGPGVSLGNAGGWRNHKLEVGFLTVATRGITQGYNLYLNKHAAGDTMGVYNYVYSDGGSTAMSDESIKGQAIDMGETTGYFHGTIAATTGPGDIAPTLKFVSGNDWTTDGAPLLDISKGSISGHITGPTASLRESGYLHTFPVDNDLPLSTAWGICNEAIPNNNLPQVNKPFTCNVTLKAGQFKANEVACVTGPNYPEQAPITEVRPVTGGSQTITISVRNPNVKGANIFQGGLCGQYISFDANLALTGYRSSYYAFGAIDPHHLIYGINNRGGVIGDLPMASEAERFGVEGHNGYHLYPGCEVITNKSMKADPICEPNSVAWATGDVIEAPHNVIVNTVGSFINLVQNTPANGSLSSGDLIEIQGMGAVGNNFIARRTANRNSYKIFDRFGGMLEAPDMHRIEGYFNSGLNFGDAPGAVIRVMGNSDGSNSPMKLFAMPGGDIVWNPATSTLTAPKIQAQNFAGLRGTSEPIGGSPLALGSCSTGKAKIAGAALNMVPTTVASTIGAPGFSPQGAFQVTAQVTASNEVTVSVCAIIAGTPKPSPYLVALQ